MKFELKFDMDNDAFTVNWRAEVQAILNDVSEAIEDDDDCLASNVQDSDGNTVGRFFVID